jgi:hypothetical protein
MQTTQQCAKHLYMEGNRAKHLFFALHALVLGACVLANTLKPMWCSHHLWGVDVGGWAGVGGWWVVGGGWWVVLLVVGCGCECRRGWWVVDVSGVCVCVWCMCGWCVMLVVGCVCVCGVWVVNSGCVWV